MPKRIAFAASVAYLCSLSVFAHAQTPPQSTPPSAPASQAQTAAPATALLRVFVDCNECDLEYLRQNVQFVDYVRDRAVADVHVLVTTERTGGGGMSWSVKFIGLGRLQGQDRTLAFTTGQTATDDDRRKEFARIYRIGLVPYVADTPALAQLDVSWKRPAETTQATAAKDPWNFWVFRLNFNGNMNGEQSSKSQSIRTNFSANRTTEQWKLQFNGNGSQNRNTFEVPEEDINVRTVTQSWNINFLAVKSLTPKWSVGAEGAVSHSSFSNNARSLTVRPAIEYDFFPYSESANRKLTVQYGIGLSRFNYREITIFDKITETAPSHRVMSFISFRQPWGSLQVQSEFAQFLDELRHYQGQKYMREVSVK